MISRRLVEVIKLDPRRAYKIAHAARLHPSTFSKILNGIERVELGDPRVLAIGKVVGLPASELFAPDHEDVGVEA